MYCYALYCYLLPCLRPATGPDFSDFLTGQEVLEKYSVEAPSWTVGWGWGWGWFKHKHTIE